MVNSAVVAHIIQVHSRDVQLGLYQVTLRANTTPPHYDDKENLVLPGVMHCRVEKKIAGVAAMLPQQWQNCL